MASYCATEQDFWLEYLQVLLKCSIHYSVCMCNVNSLFHRSAETKERKNELIVTTWWHAAPGVELRLCAMLSRLTWTILAIRRLPLVMSPRHDLHEERLDLAYSVR